jgi:hypothetical protein
MVRTIAAFVFCLLAVPAFADNLTLAKHYKATGTNPDGSTYTGDVQVEIISDTTFSIVWTISGTKYKGFGMHRNNAIAATYEIDGQPGLVVYKVDGNGWDGAWAVRGQNGNGTEHLTPAD